MAVILLLILALTAAAAGRHPLPVRAAPGVASVPLFASLARDKAVRGYTAPITLNVTLHRFIFTFHFRLAGTVRYAAPDRATFVIDRVPEKYSHLFNDLGTPLTWQHLYALTLRSHTTVDGRPGYSLEGVPRKPSDVDRMAIQTSDPQAPVYAQWYLHDGWTVDSTIEERAFGAYLFPTRDVADITGHGYHIHSDMTYGNYALDTE